MLRPAKRPTGAEARAILRRLVREIRSHWPRVEILIRADSHYCAPEVLDLCHVERLDTVLGVAATTTLHRHVAALEHSTTARHAAVPGRGKLCRYKEFWDGAGSWSRVERIIARVVALKTRVMLHLPSACPDKAILRLALERLPRLTC